VTILGVLTVAALAGAAAPAPTSAYQIRDHRLTVQVNAGSNPVRYASRAIVVTFSPGYRAEISYVGARNTAAKSYDGLTGLIAAHPNSFVMNGGFYANDPSTPAGLLLIEGRTVAPFNKNQSGVLCLRWDASFEILYSRTLVANGMNIGKLCRSALQSFPIVLFQGRNGINSGEFRRQKYVRSLIGTREDGTLVAAFFTEPIHLYAAAEFMRTRNPPGGAVQITGDLQQGIRSSQGLGLSNVLNLGGDSDTFAALSGRVLAGSPYRQIASAIVIK
jgi:uncharacterized protein YigE (DUF2233 family)